MTEISPWRWRLYWLASTWAIVIAVYSATFADMVGVWVASRTFNHCFLIPLIAFYLALHRRAELGQAQVRLAPWALVFIFANSLLWTIGELVAIAAAQHAAVVGFIIGFGWLLLGSRIFLILIFPFLYLYFAVPEGDFLVPYLQDLTAQIIVVMLQMSDIPVFLEGRYLSIPSGNFVVAEACSGINYLFASVSIGAMFAYLRFRTPVRRLLFVALAIGVPLIANGLRAYGIVMIAHLSDYRYALGIDHFIYGWVFFGVVIFLLFAIGNFFAEDGQDLEHDSKPMSDPSVATMRQTDAVILIVGFMAVAAPPVGISMTAAERAAASPIVAPDVAGWVGTPASSFLHGRFVGASQSFAVRYDNEDARAPVNLEMHYYQAQVADMELINQRNVIFDDKRFKEIEYGQHKLDHSGYIGIVNELVLRKNSREYLIWYWYDVGDWRVTTRFGAKLAEGMVRIGFGSDGGAAVILSTEVGTLASARETLARFVKAADLRVVRLQTPP